MYWAEIEDINQAKLNTLTDQWSMYHFFYPEKFITAIVNILNQAKIKIDINEKQ